MRDLSARGNTVLLTTHAMDEAESLCDRVAIIANGTLAALGTPAALTQAATAEEIRFTATPAIDRAALGLVLGAKVVEIRPGTYEVAAAPTPARIADLACFLRDRDTTLVALETGRRSLEAVFLQLTAESE